MHRFAARRVAIALAVAVALSLIGVAAIAADNLLRAPIHRGETINILLLGSDEGPLRRSDPLRGRADSFALLSVSPNRDRVTIVNFPRDAYVSVPGRGNTRINACLTAGPENCVQTMRANWGVDIDHHIVTDFNGFRAAVNRFGGVTIGVDQPLYDGGVPITETGRQRLGGMQSLTFVRDRKNRSRGDFGRATAHGHYLMEAHREIIRGGAHPARVATTVAILQQTTVTDLSPSQLLRLAFLATTIDPDDVRQITLDGGFLSVGGASMVRLTDRSHAVIRDVARDGRLDD